MQIWAVFPRVTVCSSKYGRTGCPTSTVFRFSKFNLTVWGQWNILAVPDPK